MKRFAAVLGGILLVAAIAYPVFAHGPGWGWGGGPHRMMGPWGAGPGYSWGYGGAFQALTQEQQKELSDLNQKFFNENAGLRSQIWAKVAELNTLLSTPNPDVEKAKKLQKEISDLKAKMAENRLEYQIQARKILPNSPYGAPYAGGHGWGYGPPMRGFGPGACWY